MYVKKATKRTLLESAEKVRRIDSISSPISFVWVSSSRVNLSLCVNFIASLQPTCVCIILFPDPPVLHVKEGLVYKVGWLCRVSLFRKQLGLKVLCDVKHFRTAEQLHNPIRHGLYHMIVRSLHTTADSRILTLYTTPSFTWSMGGSGNETNVCIYA